jgi:hypothetical protein
VPYKLERLAVARLGSFHLVHVFQRFGILHQIPRVMRQDCRTKSQGLLKIAFDDLGI